MGKRASRIAQLIVFSFAIGNAIAANIDCLMCHDGSDLVARDLVDYYTTPHANHSVNIPYPRGNPDYAPLTTGDGTIWFFDSNLNGLLDESEVQLFGPAATMTCATCHLEHDAPPLAGAPRDFIRGGNAGSRQCMLCHRI